MLETYFPTCCKHPAINGVSGTLAWWSTLARWSKYMHVYVAFSVVTLVWCSAMVSPFTLARWSERRVWTEDIRRCTERHAVNRQKSS